jgi:hypothetical protein
LPVAWRCDQHGGSACGGDFITGAWKFEGPEKTKETAYKIVEKHCDGFNVDITWENDSI